MAHCDRSSPASDPHPEASRSLLCTTLIIRLVTRTNCASRSSPRSRRGRRRAPARAAPQPPAAPPRWKALAVICVAQFMLILDLTVVNAALPGLGADLDLSRSAFTWTVSAYVLFFG